MQFIDLKKQYSRLSSDIKQRIDNVLEHGQYIMGPEVAELEKKLSKFAGSKYCLSCSSGTDALLIALMAKGIKPGDAIITTPFTYIATAEVISLLGATPVFVDIYPETFNINPNGIPDAVKKAKGMGLNPRGIIPVDLFGLPARYRLIDDIAKELNLFILEDAAQGFGGSIRGRRAGSFGDIAATSFFPAKPLGCYGDGGAIFTDSEELHSLMESIRVHGKGESKYDCDRIGLNGRLDTIQAAILIPKLDLYEEEIRLRQEVANLYSENLTGNKNIQTPFVPKDYQSVWAQYSILLENSKKRGNVIESLGNEGIPSVVYYQKSLHIQKTFKNLGYKMGDFPISENVSSRILSLPMHPYLDQLSIDKISEIIKSFI